MKNSNYLIVASVLSILFYSTADALEVDREVKPRVTIGGRLLTTMDAVDYDSDPQEKGRINLGDSSILTRFDKRLYREGVAGAVIGLKEADSAGNNELRLHELYVFYWNQDINILLGRTRLRNTLIEFPSLRDDDLLIYTHVGNASSNDEFDQLYANQFAVDWTVDKKFNQYSVWTGTRNNDATHNNAPDGFDSVGAGYVYQQPEDLLYVHTVRHAGLLFDRQRVNTSSKAEWMNAVIAGADFNLNRNPTASWSMATQAIVNQGISNANLVDIINGASDAMSSRAASESQSMVVGLRYTARPHLLTRWQAAMTLAYKDYTAFSDATQWSVVSGFYYRIGQGVDLVGQASYSNYSDTLGGGSDSQVQLGIRFSLETVYNDTIGARNSILNLEHGYIP